MTELHLRRATADDVPTLSRLGARTFRETYTPISDPAEVAGYADEHFTHDQVRAWLAKPAAITLVARADGVDVGYAHVLRDTVPACVADREAVKLSRLYLVADAHGRGHGRTLLAAALAAAVELGGRSVWLGVYDRNVQAVAFYEAHGFATVGTHEFEFGGEIYHDPVMWTQLAPLPAPEGLRPLSPERPSARGPGG
jgi:ribosomal protein S18 acetylase RimI-like enzyme